MTQYIIPLIFLALFSTLGYFRGRAKNKWISGWITQECEEALKPRSTEYVNIGGTIGYNFSYSLKPPLKEAKGTFTLLPRQSVLYLPVSLLITKHDRFYLHLHTDARMLGEGHIIREDYMAKMRASVTGIEKMKRDTVVKRNLRYVILWDNNILESRLKNFLESVEEPENLMHFCSFRDNQVFFFQLRPKREQVGPILKTFMKHIDTFLSKGGT